MAGVCSCARGVVLQPGVQPACAVGRAVPLSVPAVPFPVPARGCRAAGHPLSPSQCLAGWCSHHQGMAVSCMAPGLSELFIVSPPRFLAFNQFCLNFPKLPEALLELSSTTAALLSRGARQELMVLPAERAALAWHGMARHSMA